MSRFFKSAAFPILIVIVLAFFASKLIARSDQAPAKSFAGFLEQIDKGQVQTVTLRTKDNSAEVTLRGADKARYEVGYPIDYSDVLGQGRGADHRLRRQAGPLERDPVVADVRPAVPDLHRVLDLLDEPGPRRRLEGDVLRQVARQAPVRGLAEDHVP